MIYITIALALVFAALFAVLKRWAYSLQILIMCGVLVAWLFF